MMREWNISDRNKYYRQNNNQIKPFIRCKPTYTIEALDLAGWPLPTGPYKQPEDNLTAYTEEKFGPDSPEDWNSIKKAINEHFLPNDKPIIGPRWDWDIREALFGITKGIPFAASTRLTHGGHIGGIIGFVTKDDKAPKSWIDIKIEDVTEIIFNDPYGKRIGQAYNTGLSGFNTRYSTKEFMTYWRNTGIQVRKK